MTTPLPQRVDLHTHTTRSDGVMEPMDLYGAMEAHGMRICAISDHDTLEGYRQVRDAVAGQEGQLRLIPAVEINTVTRGVSDFRGFEIHILGYGVDADDEAFVATLERQRAGRSGRLETMLCQLDDAGAPVRQWIGSFLPNDGTSAGRPHVARALVEGGYASSVQDAFDRWLVGGRPGYVAREGLDPHGAIRAIRAAGGIPVLAHFAMALERPDLLDQLVDAGLGGLEVHYGGQHRDFERGDTVRKLAALAADRGLLVTGGSDYHGDTMSYAEAQARTYVPLQVGEQLLAAIGAATRSDTPAVRTT